MCRRRRFAAPLCSRGFTPTLERQLQLPRLLARGVVEIHGRLALLSVRPFAPSEASEVRAHPARLRGPLLRPLLTSRSASWRRPFRREARSPQVRVVAFAALSPDLRRLPLVARTSRIRARSSWLAAPSIRFLFVDTQLLLLASFSADLAVGVISPCDSLGVPATKSPRGLSPPGHAHAGHTRVAAPVAGGGSHGTVRVVFTYGSSGPPVVTPAAGRVTTSPCPRPA